MFRCVNPTSTVEECDDQSDGDQVAVSANIQDLMLAGKAARGDRGAMIEVVKRSRPRVQSRVYRLTPFYDEVEDIVQDVMVQILSSIGRYQGNGCLEAWADAVALRTTFNKNKRFRRQRQTFAPEQDHELISSSDVEKDYLSRARSRRIALILRQMPSTQRVVLIMRMVNGYSLAEIAEMVGRRQESIRYLLKKARKNLLHLASKDRILKELFDGANS
jgi:RNA polymerase sigma-70 factor (ECF subfamily)